MTPEAQCPEEQMDVYVEDEDIRRETKTEVTIQKGEQESRCRQILRREPQTRERARRSMEPHRATLVAETAPSRRDHDLGINPEPAIQREV
jgi:hypothetical protein